MDYNYVIYVILKRGDLETNVKRFMLLIMMQIDSGNFENSYH